jgi:cell wall-associated NlpC family hydrolase
MLLAAIAAVLSVLTISVMASAPAGAATGSATWGRFASVLQHRNGSVVVSGWSYDQAHPAGHPRICITEAGHCVRVVRPSAPSPRFNRQHHIAATGGHSFAVRLRPTRPGVQLTLRAERTADRLDTARVVAPGTRVVSVAKRFVGGRYTYAGASPRTGFDCSGYVMYAYRHARVASLPHNAEAQRRHMHRISRAGARPGDLVFYLSGGHAYHVAIYAGHGHQYSASSPRLGIRYEPVRGRNIRFGTDWHP